MKKQLFIIIFSVLCLASSRVVEAKIAPYLKLCRGAVSAAGAVYFAKNAYTWHNHASNVDSHTAEATYARYRSYLSMIAALVLGISGFMAIESSLERLDK